METREEQVARIRGMLREAAKRRKEEREARAEKALRASLRSQRRHWQAPNPCDVWESWKVR